MYIKITNNVSSLVKDALKKELKNNDFYFVDNNYANDCIELDYDKDNGLYTLKYGKNMYSSLKLNNDTNIVVNKLKLAIIEFDFQIGVSLFCNNNND